jgi:hypothetical protein
MDGTQRRVQGCTLLRHIRKNLFDIILGEKVTTEISKQEEPKGMPENKKVARRGGKVAGNARKATEKELGKSVVIRENYLELSAKKKVIKKRKR